MPSYYYSGQGTLYEGLRNVVNGEPLSLRNMCNVPELELSVDVTKFEHKESKSGQRGIDLTVIQEKNVTLTATLENLDPYNLALAMWGTRSVVEAGVFTDAVVNVPATETPVPIGEVNIDGGAAAPTVRDAAGAGGAVLPANAYTIDRVYGTFQLANPLVPPAAVDTDYYISGAQSGHVRVDALTQTSVERYLRFHGLNTVDGEAVIIDLYRVSLDPLQGYALLNDEISQLTVSGNVLLDSLHPAPNQYFHQINLGRVEGAPT